MLCSYRKIFKMIVLKRKLCRLFKAKNMTIHSKNEFFLIAKFVRLKIKNEFIFDIIKFFFSCNNRISKRIVFFASMCLSSSPQQRCNKHEEEIGQ